MKAPVIVLMASMAALTAASSRAAAADAGSAFAMDYPQWNQKKSGDPLNVHSSIRSDQQCYFDLNAANAPADGYIGLVRGYMEKQGAKILSDAPLSYEFKAGGQYTFLAKTRSLFCDGKTYLATVTCLKETYDAATATKIFDSMHCGNAAGAAPAPAAAAAAAAAAAPVAAGAAAPAAAPGAANPLAQNTQPAPPPAAQPAAQPAAEPATASATQLAAQTVTPAAAPATAPAAGTKPKLGVVVSPAGGFSAESVSSAFRLARESGAEITYFSMAWADVEKERGRRDWKGTDYMMDQLRKSGLRVSLVIRTIHTAIRGQMPSDVQTRGWEDPELIRRFTDFTLAALQRYGDVVDYLEIGNEVNAYLANHPDEVGPYGVFFKRVYDAVKAKYPNVSVGMVFAYRELKESDTSSIYKRLALGDHDSFTLYAFSNGFAHTLKPSSIFDQLKEIERLTGNRHFALEEVGWTTSPALKGSAADQQAAVRAFFDYRDQAPARLDFISWFNLHDGRGSDCDAIAGTFSRKGDALSKDRNAMKLFSDFLCNFGLRHNDGRSKPAWDEWTKRAK